MSVTSRLAGALLITTGLVSPSLAFAQENASPPSTQAIAGEAIAEPPSAPPREDVDISAPGAGNDIVVTGRRTGRNVARSSDQVVSVLSSEEIARTGEGNIAGALGRVTGLSVVGSGFVYVRGLGDRYSLALLNGSPLPSPEPLKRVVPLDLFPSGVISSSLVQKSYSVNYPGEFGGGVINLTTKSTPNEPFLTIGGSLSGDTETIGQLGYSYYGAKSDWTGFDNGSRDVPPALADFFESGQSVNSGNVDSSAIGAQLVRFSRAVVQKVPNLPPNFSVNLSGGKTFDLGGAQLGIIGGAGFSNKWQNREATQQTSFSADLETLQTDFRRVTTDNRIVANGLLGLGLEFGPNKIRWTNLYIRDTIKQARLGLGHRNETVAEFMQQDTAWFERQLIDTQLVGEFKPMADLSIDLRAGYANSQREAPYQTSLEYVRTNSASDLFGAYFVNNLNGNTGNASVTFSELNEDLWSGGADVSYRLSPTLNVTVGGAYSNTVRDSSRRQFLFRAGSDYPAGTQMLRPDLLLSEGLVTGLGIRLIEPDESTPAFQARLKNWAGYAKLNADLWDTLSLDAGVRYEKAKQSVAAVQVFATPPSFVGADPLDNAYWLPAATLTWKASPELQVRVSGSKTIARPQFRELIYQPFFDPESNRQFVGNPQLIDSQLYNAEARVEWYFAPEQKVTVSGFYKKIKNPIEAYVRSFQDEPVTSYANAPEAQLYGAEFELTKYFDMSGLGGAFTNRRAVVLGNYTYTQSKLKVGKGDLVQIYGAPDSFASDYFRNSSPLTGQSDHLVNVQLGLENTERLSQQTILISYASERVVSRGVGGAQPDVIERPGVQIDLVAREGFQLMKQQAELKFEARNLLGTRHREYQQSADRVIEFNTYDLGRLFAISASVTF